MKLFRRAVWAVVVVMIFSHHFAYAKGGLTLNGGKSARLVVSPDGPYRSIFEAVEKAQPGAIVEVHAGYYPEELVIEKSIILQGVGWPVVDGGGDGTVITIAAPDTILRGFEIRGSGTQPDRNHAGVVVTAPNVVVEDNRLREVLFGIYVAQADHVTVRNNNISSISEFEIARKGDAIRYWYSHNGVVENNHIHKARDVVIWYSANIVLRQNLIENGRYGIHLMYCDDAKILDNLLRDNSVGIFTMYSNRVELSHNDIRRQRGPSGYALGFKDASAVAVHDNMLADNRTAIYLDGTPFIPVSFALVENNIIAFNDIGITLLPAVQGAEFLHNTFWENVEQVSIQGGGHMGENLWKGNYWSDYAGIDLDGDGIGEKPYQADRLFENLTDREPLLRALIYSPAVQAVEFAASSFPVFKPQPKLSDSAPSLIPATLDKQYQTAPSSSLGMALVGMGLLALGGLSFFLIRMQGEQRMRLRKNAGKYSQVGGVNLVENVDHEGNRVILQIEGLSKYYANVAALADVTFKASDGDFVALWGANGAGKTTLIKAILGLIDYQGSIRVAGLEASRYGKQVRRRIGYVPQETLFYDQSVSASLDFYARLKGSDQGRIPDLLDRLGLVVHAQKPVPALSGGLKQRLALAIGLLSDPPLLLLDEPTANLDSKARYDYLKLLSDLRREKKTVIFASHRIEEVGALADRVLVLESGRIVEEMTPLMLRRKLAVESHLALWLADEADRMRALQILEERGWNAHLNGRGTVVVQIETGQKMQALDLLASKGVSVIDFDLEREISWN